MSVLAKLKVALEPQPDDAAADIAEAYNQAGDRYITYADGDPRNIYAFDGMYAYADRQVWALLEERLKARFATGARSITILDVGCGPGTWLRRAITRAYAIGFKDIRARGFDLAEAQIVRARQLARSVARLPGVVLSFEVADATQRFKETDASIDLTICLYGVLNHLPIIDVPDVLSEIARVTAGEFIATVRAVGSTPTIYVDSVRNARRFRQDHHADRFDVDLVDGRHIEFSSHLFAAAELRAIAARHFEIDRLRGLDVFHTRFSPDPRWNPVWLSADDQIGDELNRLEEIYACDPEFIDRATHLLLVARRRR